MWTITNLLRTASIYTRGYISRKYISYRIINGKLQPANNNELNDALELYEYTVLSGWGFIGNTWSEHMVDNAYRTEVARHRKIFRQYPVAEWDLSNVNDPVIIQKWNSMKTMYRIHVNGTF